MGTGRGMRQALGRIAPAVGDTRGMAFITAVFFTFAVGMLLFAFAFLNQNEAGFAGFTRDSTEALSLADAGAQEAVDRLSNGPGGIAGTTCFGISLANGAACSASPTAASLSNQVFFEAPLASNSLVFPVISVGTFAGRQRAVRLFEQAVFKTGFADVIYGPQVTFQGNGQPITGDTYSATSVVFQSYVKSPSPATGATPTNLINPQIMAGSQISSGSGPSNPGPYSFECATQAVSTTEVAPTPCPAVGRNTDTNANVLPVNWHPMTPAGMPTADFNTVISACYSGACSYLSFVQAAQNGVGVTYTPLAYTPSYWSAPATSATNGKVMLAVATGPFCVNGAAVAAGACTTGGITYGNASSPTSPMRYLDWGLVTDDLSRSTAATTFFQPPSCSTCNSGGPNGKQNGIRYIPLTPSLIPTPLTSLACKQNVNPGSNVFDNVTADGLSCPAPITMLNTTNVTFSGTKSNPEFLVIDNGAAGGTQVHINGSINGPGTCSSNFDNYNWGVIVATGDIDLTANMVFTGFIYTNGYVYSHGTVVVSGGIFSANSTGGTQVNQVDSLGNVNFCASSSTQIVLSPQFFTFKTVSWQDLPLPKSGW